ncbi:hypothetical protein P153DRAFT_401911 [Dothidotthia symphoricarpi CBS 119687]|uniref:Uncharacterized protein n=1 Tax=Dothidotthia symphoricarpi CBS 119687 TaxID=1392245 RepID=A0A6A5ZYN5_9PLEO|nr:uncharacterized protein P153DRAFT_401911 [Dothidotthia symphoricarpi CBS 119687]KAF2123431.1 hypothetical protein P153DRAFT_401911 [Dothidotthia symphoricarpi CBS 119687]
MSNNIPFATPPAVAQWGCTITYKDYNNMLKGYKPRVMEDKWLIETNAPDDAQGITVHIYFGWTSREEISLDIAAGDPTKTEAKDWATIVKISWKAQRAGGSKVSEKEAKTMAISLFNNLMGCEVEDEDEDEDGNEDE